MGLQPFLRSQLLGGVTLSDGLKERLRFADCVVAHRNILAT
jgi:hypothetical protein